MLLLTPLYDLIPRILPFDCLDAVFMQQALVGLMLLMPMAATMGVQVVNFRMAFFSDAISHSAFAGVALGMIFAIDPHLTMPVFGVLVGLCIMSLYRKTRLSSDTVVGVIFSAVVAFGLAMVSRDRTVARDMQRFLYGDILTIGNTDILILMALFVVLMLFQAYSYNKLLYIGINGILAKAHRVRIPVYQYGFAAMLSLIVMFSVWAVGVLLVTAMIIVPAAAARNFSRGAGSMFWWSLIISLSAAVSGLILSAQPWAGTATGATIILVAFGWFLISLVYGLIRH